MRIREVEDQSEYETNMAEDLCSAPALDCKGHPPVRPLIVFRLPKLHGISIETVRESPQARQQFSAAQRYADLKQAHREQAVLIFRSNAPFLPAQNARLVETVEAARGRELLVMDDIFRLIDCRDGERANASLQSLCTLNAAFYSIDHGRALSKRTIEFFIQQMLLRVMRSQTKSQSIRKGLERTAEWRYSPTREAIEKAVRAKKRRADARAAELMPEIERVRAEMGEEKRSSRAAIADALNAAGVATPSRKGKWQGTTVKRVLERAGRSLDG